MKRNTDFKDLSKPRTQNISKLWTYILPGVLTKKNTYVTWSCAILLSWASSPPSDKGSAATKASNFTKTSKKYQNFER